MILKIEISLKNDFVINMNIVFMEKHARLQCVIIFIHAGFQ